jgi:nitrogen fixation protein FixH
MTATTAPEPQIAVRAPSSAIARFIAQGLHWPLIIVALLAVPVVAGGYLAWMATHDPTFAIESDYYRKAVAWDQTMAQEQANAQLGWQTAVTATPQGQQVDVAVQLHDKAGLSVADAKLHVDGFFLARSKTTESADARIGADGRYHVLLNLPHGGLHELRVRAERGQQIFTATHRLDIAR